MNRKWNDELSTGLYWIDSEHKKIVNAANEFTDNVEKGEGSSEALSTLSFVKSFMLGHFNNENNYMLKYDYPHYQSHLQNHNKCLNEFDGIIAKYEKEGASSEVVKDIESFMINYLENHIYEFDIKMAEFLRKKTVKE